MVNFGVQVKAWIRTNCSCGILYFKPNGIDAINNLTIINWNDFIYIAEREFKVLGWRLSVFLEKPLNEVCVVRIQVGEKGPQLVPIGIPTMCCPKHSKYVVNQKLKQFDNISYRELLGESVVLFYIIRFVTS